jgi:carboxyl-terminal processing protease
MRLLLSLALLVGLSLLLPAADEKPDAERIARLIAQLGSDDFKVRETATRELEALDAAAIPALRRAEADSKDPEVCYRATELLVAIHRRARLATDFAQIVGQAGKLIHESFILEVPQGELTALAVRGLYDAIGEKVPPKFADRMKNPAALDEAARSSLLFDVRHSLGNRSDLFEQKDLHIAIRAMIHGIDPHGKYFEPEGCIYWLPCVGVGLELDTDPATKLLRVISPIKDSPAHKAGIFADDLITHITQREDGAGNPLNPPEVTATKGQPLTELTGKLLGNPNTKVEVTLQRTGEPKPLVFTLNRASVNSETVLGLQRRADASWDYLIDKEKRIGYLRLKQFSRDSDTELKKAIESLEKDGFKSLILDLRFNTGGLLQAAVRIADHFVDESQEILRFWSRKGEGDTWRAETKGNRPRFPVVVLVNGQSSSASEILAACLQDHKRAMILGERTKGKGSVQNVWPFKPIGQQIILTSAIFLRASGAKLDRLVMPGRDADEWGVKPDRIYALTDAERADLEEHLKRLTHIVSPKQQPNTGKPGFNDRQLAAAVEYLRSRN